MRSIYMALLLGLSWVVGAQQKISGTVSDAQHKPLSGATVSIPQLHKETISDLQGYFALGNLPAGTFQITISFVGYTTHAQTITVGSSPITLQIVLEESHQHMDEVVVSTAFNKLQSQNVMKVEHLSAKTLQQKGAATLMEGLATIPGVSQISTGTAIGKPVIRGLSGNRVLVYTQGVRLENQQFGEEHGLGLNDSGVESAEVIKGPASLLYGSDAMGGVLYFNPEKFTQPNTLKGDYSQRFFSNTHGSSSMLGAKTSSQQLKFLVRGRYDTHADYKTADSGRVTNSRYNEADFKTAFGFANSGFSSTLRYNYNKLNIGIPEAGIAAQSTLMKPDYPRQQVSSHILSLNNTLHFSRSKMDINLGYIGNDRKEFEDNPAPVLHMDLRTLNYDAKYYFPKWGKLESILGIQGMWQSNTNSGQELLIPDARVNDFGCFGTSHYQWGSNTLQAGLRFDTRSLSTQSAGEPGSEGYFAAIDRSFNSFNAAVGIRNNSLKNLIVRLNLASGFRAPNLAELTSNGVHEGSNRYEIGNAGLNNERNVQLDLNLEYKSSHFELFANGFYNHIANYIFIAPNGSVIEGKDVYDYLQANARLLGGEAGIHFHPHPLDWLHITSSFESVRGQKANGENLPLIPANRSNSNLRVEFPDGKWFKESFTSLTVEHTFSQNKAGLFETPSKDYTLLHFALGGSIQFPEKVGMGFSLNVNNLLNRSYIAHLSRLKNDGIPNMGRNVVFGISLSM